MKAFLITTVAVACLLAGCSSTQLAYNQVGWWGPWAARDYVPLDRGQRSQLRGDLRELRDWHCETEMPKYAQWLDERREKLRYSSPDESDLASWLDDALAAWDRTIEHALPVIVGTLRSLDGDQTEALFDNLAERNKELETDYREPSLDTQITERAERLEERLERWFGSVSDEQRALIEDWSYARGDQNSGWLDNRYLWQSHFRAALKQREDDEAFDHALTELIVNPATVRTEAYQQQASEARRDALTLAVQLLESRDEEQRKHLDDKLSQWQDRLQRLACD